jgi:peptidoglycan hydrolase-like protein with peptidoglycan-binding domain
MKIALMLFLGVWMANPLWADDLTRAVQQRLKGQGFYYGDVDGQGGDETSAAIRRFQIRYGLKVTGQLNDETLRSLGMSANGAVRPAVPGNQEKGGSSDEQPNDPYYRQVPKGYDSRPVPPAEGPEDYNEMQPPAFAPPGAVTSLPRLYAGTIYERAPAQVQENVLYAVQGELMRRGLFRGMIDGRPGPATTEALVRLQQYEGLPVTGRLDNETLNDLRAFPGQQNGPPEQGFHHRPGGERIYRDFPDPF